MLIHPYHESVVSQLYPGAQHSANCLVPAVTAFETLLALPPEHRSKVVWRLDQGFGGDHNINWLLDRRYGVLAKGCSNRRAALLAQQVKRWRAVRDDKWVGSVRTPAGFSHPLETFAIRYTVPTGWKHTYLFSTLKLAGVATAQLYDQRGGAETEFRSDKSGGLQSINAGSTNARPRKCGCCSPTSLITVWLGWPATCWPTALWPPLVSCASIGTCSAFRVRSRWRTANSYR